MKKRVIALSIIFGLLALTSTTNVSAWWRRGGYGAYGGPYGYGYPYDDSGVSFGFGPISFGWGW